ncbi:MAG: hypothetical protein P8Y00_12410, partial [Deltaproteobacteria bacterium]
ERYPDTVEVVSSNLTVPTIDRMKGVADGCCDPFSYGRGFFRLHFIMLLVIKQTILCQLNARNSRIGKKDPVFPFKVCRYTQSEKIGSRAEGRQKCTWMENLSFHSGAGSLKC